MHSFYEPTLQCVNWRDDLLGGVSSEYANRLTERLTSLDLKKGYVQANTWLRGNIERYQILSQLGSMKACVTKEVERRAKRENNAAAMTYLYSVKQRLWYCDEWIHELSSDKLKIWSDEKSRRFEMSYTALLHKHDAYVFEFVRKSANTARAAFNCWDDLEKVEALIKRMVTSEWWVRQAKRQYRVVEAIRRECGQVCNKESPYVSRWGVQRYRKQKQTSRAFLESYEAVNQYEQRFLLSELADKSISNARHKTAELAVRTKGFQFLAAESGHHGFFLTLTCPSKYHAVDQTTGYRNGKFYKFGCPTPKDANDYLNGVWQRMRASYKRKNIKYYGVRVVEPHHDACPHWHLVLFVDPKHSGQLLTDFVKYAFEEDGDEVGALENRIKIDYMDPEQGGAIAYIMKYITKNIDGVNASGEAIGVDNDTGLNSIDSAERVQAWKSRWGIRQFSFVGGSSVTVWREIRKLKQELIPSSSFASIYAAAKANDFKRFIVLMGGLFAGRKQSLKPIYDTSEKNRFGEVKKVIAGLVAVATGEPLTTRLYDWIVQRVGSGAGSWSGEAVP